MRGATEALLSAHPIGDTLPSVLREDAFTQRMCEGLDVVLAPIISALDNASAYLDLTTAPDDLLPWLARWVGMATDSGLPAARQRELLRATIELQGWQGTRRGIELAVEALFGVRTVVADSGGAVWSVEAGDPLPGESAPAIVVQVFPDPGQTVDRLRLDDVVATIKPAHVMHRVQVVVD